MARKRQTSAKTRVKLSQAAKRRQRAPSGSAYGGQFLAGFLPTMHAQQRGGRRPTLSRPAPPTPPGDIHGPERLQRAQQNKQRWQQDLEKAGVQGVAKERLSNRGAYSDTFRQLAQEEQRRVATDANKEPFKQYGPSAEELTGGPVRVNLTTRREVNRRLADTEWRAEQGRRRGVYEPYPEVGRPPIPDAEGFTGAEERIRTTGARGGVKPPSQFIREDMAPTHRQWLEQQLADPNSPFNVGLDPTTTTATRGRTRTPGARRRLEKYTEALQKGASHREALDLVQQDRRGRRPEPSKDYLFIGNDTRPIAQRGGVPAAITQETLDRTRGRPEPKADRYEVMKLKPEEFKFGVEATTPRSIEKLRETFPGLTDNQYVMLREADRMTIGDEITKNAKWAHETKRAQLLGITQGKADATPDRVTFFTTNLGGPELSVPSDSLVGQYIIQRRKTVMRKEGSATRGALRGEFPKAIRDQHIIEVKAMGGASVQGRFGIVQESGVRAGSWATRGFGKRAPIGANVLTDSSGRPIFDAKGNIRYSDGASREYEVGTDKVRGLRIFVG